MFITKWYLFLGLTQEYIAVGCGLSPWKHVVDLKMICKYERIWIKILIAKILEVYTSGKTFEVVVGSPRYNSSYYYNSFFLFPSLGVRARCTHFF
jgi:hypothetical protein